MKNKTGFAAILALVAFGAGINPAFAHAHVKSMNIAEKAQLKQAPPEFTVNFSEKAGLVKVTLTRSTGEGVPLAYTPTKDMADSYKIPLPALSKGEYTLSWRTIGDDGHAMNGGVHFKVTGN